jgi:hypothetical protein
LPVSPSSSSDPELEKRPELALQEPRAIMESVWRGVGSARRKLGRGRGGRQKVETVGEATVVGWEQGEQKRRVKRDRVASASSKAAVGQRVKGAER